MHEHIFVRHPEIEESFPSAAWDEDRALATAREGMERLVAKGITTMVDLTVLGLGRSIPRIQKLAESVEMNIVVATGYYTASTLPLYFHTRGPGRVMDMREPLETMFLKEIQTGIGDTGVKAAVIKVVTDEAGITPDVERILRSAARAQLETGVLISTHTHAGLQTGRLQQDFFRNEGVDLERVLIGHSGDSEDLDYLKELMDNGSTLGLDRFGLDSFLAEAKRIDTLCSLIEAGYADRLTLSHDASYFSINVEPSYVPPGRNHELVSDRVLPAIRERGVGEDVIHQMLVANPARLLSRAG